MSTPIRFNNIPSLNELKNGFPDIKALFFDMDGTLFDTEKYHAQALIMMGTKYKIRPPHPPEVIHALMVGKADHLVFEIIKNWEGFPSDWQVHDFVNEKNQNLIQILKQINPNDYFLPALRELLKLAIQEQLFLALVTSSEKIVTQELLNMTELSQTFNLILTRDDCPNHKPDPWPYLKAMEVSMVDKTQILIFEDSQVGLEAATNSGAHVIKVEWY